MAYLTYADLSDLRKSEGFVKLAESLRKSTTASAEKKIFLSHKHDEKKLVEETEAFFRKIGVNIYVDWRDTGMPPTTNPETAILLKKQIRASSKFLVLATKQATTSNWVSWELGFADGVRNDRDIALLPICSDAGTWTDREYFGAYNRIEKSDKGNWCVFSPSNEFVAYLKDWLKEGK